MELTRPSIWNLFLHCFDKKKSIRVVSEFLKENNKIKPVGEIEYFHYWKLKSMQARFLCLHTAPSWNNLVYDLILTTQHSATGLIFTDSIDRCVDIFSNDVFGAKSGIRSLSVTCVRKDSLEI